MNFKIDCERLVRRTERRADAVLLGDSIAAATVMPDGWVNRGLANDSLNDVNGDVFDRLTSELLHPNPLAIAVFFGLDDLRRGFMSIDELANLYDHLITQLGYLHSTSTLVVAGLPQVSASQTSLNANIAEFNEKLREISGLRGLPYWDVNRQLQEQGLAAVSSGRGADDQLLNKSALAETAAFLDGAWRASKKDGSGPVQIGEHIARFDVEKLGYDLLAAYGRECWSTRIGSSTEDDVVRHFITPEIDYFVRYLETGAHTFRDLYVGSRAKFIAANEHCWKDRRGGITAMAASDAKLWIDSLTKQNVDAKILERVSQVHKEIAPYFTASAPATVRLLFIGDCLLEDVELMIGADLLRQGFLVAVDPIVTKNPAAQIQEIQARAGTKYGGVVYSPLSWEFDVDFRNCFETKPQLSAAVDRDIELMTDRIGKRVRLLADLFDCNIYVHNTAAVLRASNDTKRMIRSVATRYKRKRVRSKIADFLAELVAEINAASFEHLYIVDEASAVRESYDDVSLGRFIYYVSAIHPTELSVLVATQISRYVSASLRLSGKKAIVCDLDNTLWDGVIGEGLGVRHCRNRQRILSNLKARGIVLAICSKNDPANVKWVNSVLSSDDFVASEVSWGSKAVGIGRIAEALNLKAKDFVFIDDRPDERQLVSDQYASLVALDPCEEATWILLETWSKLLSTAVGADRTEMYKQRAERQKLLSSRSNDDVSDTMLASLKLKLDIRRSTDGDLKRIFELINRTNQWNLQGSRCSFQDVKDWHDSNDFRIYSARVKDKFGDMGLISVCVGKFTADALELKIFVLSCRVFGFGVETMLLRELEKDAAERFGQVRVRGVFVPTAHNAPSKDFFARHGYSERDGAWIFSDAQRKAPEPGWFEKVSIQK
ncbi:HAD-IIIC family phosphatase [Bradyrhizobium sp. McL0615]|uniref:HAD-IIIC family phosphatase n=1 Tax=Bradyrhizobium sp. McL0615 TaxID=3415673 RepID=UPI003CECE879